MIIDKRIESYMAGCECLAQKDGVGVGWGEGAGRASSNFFFRNYCSVALLLLKQVCVAFVILKRLIIFFKEERAFILGSAPHSCLT